MSDCRQRLTGCSTCVICLTRSPPRRCESVYGVECYLVFKYSRICVARYDIFGKYGAIRQIRVGNTPETRGTAFVIYEDIFDAKNACDHLSGFNVCNRYDEYYALWLTLTGVFRYLVVLYYQANKAFEKLDAQKKEADLQKMKEKYNLNTPAR